MDIPEELTEKEYLEIKNLNDKEKIKLNICPICNYRLTKDKTCRIHGNIEQINEYLEIQKPKKYKKILGKRF